VKKGKRPPLKVKLVPIASLKLDGKNARKHGEGNLAAIRASLEKFEQVEPLVVHGRTGKVIGGNGRLKVLRELGIKKVPVVEVDLPLVEIRALAIALNRTGELAEWDIGALGEELRFLSDKDFDLGLTGFGPKEARRLMASGEIPEQNPIPPVPKKPVTKAGDVWRLGDHRVMCGDATDKTDVSKLVAGTELQMMITDPPYGVGYDPQWRERYDEFERHSTDTVPNDDRVNWAAAFKLFRGAVAYVWHAGVHAAEVSLGLADSEFEIRAQIIWTKQHFVFGRGAYHWKHEPCWYAVRKGKGADWIGDRKQTTVWEIVNANPMGGAEDDVNTTHATQKPVECMARPIRNHSGDVYDPFLGSGTTLIAAEQLGRICYAMEIDPGYCDVSVQRWEQMTGGKAKREKARKR